MRRAFNEGDNWISKSNKGVAVILEAYKGMTKVEVHWPLDRTKERDAYLERFSNYETSQRETGKVAIIEIPLFGFGRAEVERWDEIRKGLVDVGTAAMDRYLLLFQELTTDSELHREKSACGVLRD